MWCVPHPMRRDLSYTMLWTNRLCILRPSQPPPVHSRPYLLIPRIVCKHRLAYHVVSKWVHGHDVEREATHCEFTSQNLLARPALLTRLGEELHVAMCEMWSMVRVEYQDASPFGLGEREVTSFYNRIVLTASSATNH